MKLLQNFSKLIFNNKGSNHIFMISQKFNVFSSGNFSTKNINGKNDNSSKSQIKEKIKYEVKDKDKNKKEDRDEKFKTNFKLDKVETNDETIKSIIKDLITDFKVNTSENKKKKHLKKKIRRLARKECYKASKSKKNQLNIDEINECKKKALMQTLAKEKLKRENKLIKKSKKKTDKNEETSPAKVENPVELSNNEKVKTNNSSESLKITHLTEKRKIYNQKILKLAINKLLLTSNEYSFKPFKENNSDEVKELSVIEDENIEQEESNENEQVDQANIESNTTNEETKFVLDEKTKKEIDELNSFYNNIPFIQTDYSNFSYDPIREWKNYLQGKLDKAPIVNRIYKQSYKDRAKLEKINDNILNPKYKKIHSIYEGDIVKIVSGEFTGKITKVTSIRRSNDNVYLDKTNIKMVYDAKNKLQRKPIPISQKHIKLISPFTNKTITPKIVSRDDGTKFRICPETKKEIPIPVVLRNKIVKDGKIVGLKKKEKKSNKKCTKEKSVNVVTFKGYEYGDIAKDFILRMKEKKARESLLILKDKINIDKNVLI